MTKGFTLIELMIVMAVIAIVAAIAIPGLISSQRSSNERSGSASLKMLATSEYDFRSNDRDGNGRQDFWTGDVSGLYRLVPSGPLLKLIEPSIARADGAPLAAGTAGGLMGADMAPQTAKAGYWYYALNQDLNLAPPVDYRVDMGDGMGAVHNDNRFGFTSYPDAYPRSGKLVFIMNEESVIYKSDAGVDVAAATIPKPPTGAYLNYPADPPNNGWSQMD